MPSDFLVDLIDHKRRVGFYLQKIANALFQQVNDIETQSNPDELSLIDLARMYCQSSIYVDFEFSSQVAIIRGNTRKRLGTRILCNYRRSMKFIVCDLFQRAVVHDNSKFSIEEYEIYEETFPELNKYGFGTEQFKAAVKKLGPALQHHLEVNPHHPEFYPNGINGMSLLDVIEMSCDWLAASSRSKTGIDEGLNINKERFGIDDQLFGIIKNTITYLEGER